MKRVLFLCTGNYYRSRFAEVLFNHRAKALGLKWEADSCGLRVRPVGEVNAGAISVFAVMGMKERGLAVPEERDPRQVTLEDLVRAEIVVAVKEAEHRVLLEAMFPEHAGRVEYWTVHDLDAAMPSEALGELERLVEGMVGRCVGM